MDTVAEFLTRIRNAGHAKHEKVDVPSSNMRQGIAKILENYGYIRSFKVAKDGKQGLMRVYLKYSEDGQHVIKNIQRVSRPGRRIYVGKEEIPEIRSGYGMAVLSTNRGIMSNSDAATANVGGEVLMKVW